MPTLQRWSRTWRYTDQRRLHAAIQTEIFMELLVWRMGGSVWRLNYGMVQGRIRKMHGDSKAPGEGVSGDAGHLDVDGSGAAQTHLAARGQAVTADGAWLPARPWPRRLDARKIWCWDEGLDDGNIENATSPSSHWAGDGHAVSPHSIQETHR